MYRPSQELSATGDFSTDKTSSSSRDSTSLITFFPQGSSYIGSKRISQRLHFIFLYFYNFHDASTNTTSSFRHSTILIVSERVRVRFPCGLS